MKLAIYSVSYAGVWYAGRPLTVEEIIGRAVELGVEGVEIDGKRPHGFPFEWDAARRKSIRALAEKKGIELVAVAANNDFTSPIPDEREAQMLAVGELIKLAADLGSPIVRIFVAWPGMTYVDGQGAYDLARDTRFKLPTSHLQKWKWARACIEDVAKVAEKHRVTLALQNHKPVIRHYQDLLEMTQEVGSEWVKCALDCPLIDDQSDKHITEAVSAIGDLQILTHFGGEFGRAGDGSIRQLTSLNQREFNYPTYVEALKSVGYEGYLAYELCHQFLPRRHEFGTLDDAHEQIELAFAYMRQFIGAKSGAAERRRVAV